MADKIILVDTSILIDYYRKTDKQKSVWELPNLPDHFQQELAVRGVNMLVE